MKLNKMLALLTVVSVLPLVGCQPTGYVPDITDNVTLNMSVMYQKANTRMKFGGDSVEFPYKAADGKSYNSGDFKPVWKQVQEKLNFTINDVTDASAQTIAAAFSNYQTTGFSGMNIAQGSSSDIISEGTTNGTILKLNEYFDKMPNFKKFLDENKIVATNIKDAEGDIYYAPYFDGNNDIERMLMVRTDWVEKLLDGTNPTFDTATTITSAYQPYMPDSLDTTVDAVSADGTKSIKIAKKYASGKGIIAQQNALATKNGASLTNALRTYIDETYGVGTGKTFAKRSDLFCGQNAVYDADELVALFRCVKANPTLLTGDATKSVVPYFPRGNTNDRTADLWRFGGQLFGVRGMESRSGYLYVNDEGKIDDARDDEETRDMLVRLNNMYKEGLILQDFDNPNIVTPAGDYRGSLLKGNTGFATYDYNQTTTVYNDNADCEKIDGFLFTSIMPAVTKYGDEWMHYTESWRSVKTEGWFITSATANDPNKLDRALALFDYFYGAEGNQLMSYGPDAWIEHDASGKVVTMEYQGRQVPKLSKACLTELQDLAGGNYTNYYRFYLGGTYPVGYVKEQGMEYQTVSEAAKPGLDMINKAISLGVIKHVSGTTVTNANHIYDMVPTTFSLTDVQQNALKNNYTDLSTAMNNTKGKTTIWTSIVEKGFGATDGSTTLPTAANYVSYVKAMNSESFANIYQTAYAKMIK